MKLFSGKRRGLSKWGMEIQPEEVVGLAGAVVGRLAGPPSCLSWFSGLLLVHFSAPERNEAIAFRFGRCGFQCLSAGPRVWRSARASQMVVVAFWCAGLLPVLGSASASVASMSATPPTRLETRTKESNMRASHWVELNP